MKIYNLTPSALQMFLAEAAAYINLADMQGSSITQLLALGRLPHSGMPALVLALGQPLPHTVPDRLATSAKEALAHLHEAGFSHNDISLSNLLVFNSRVLLCDLQTCQSGAAQQSFQQDVARLHRLLHN